MNFQWKIKVKNFKAFYESQTTICLKEKFSPPPDISFLRLWNKDFRTEIYRNIKIFALQVLRDCSSWASRNSAVQMFFMALSRSIFLAVLREYILSNFEWIEVRKMSEVFRAKLLCKMSDLFLLVFVSFETFYQKIWN